MPFVRLASMVLIVITAGFVGWFLRGVVMTPDGVVGAGDQLVAWLGDAGKVALGALIGAFGAWIVSRANREEASRTRFHDDLRTVATDLVRAAERHRQQREDQFSAWVSAVGAGTGGPLPQVEGTQPIFDAAVALDLVAHRETAKAAWSVYGESVYLDRPQYTYDAKRHGETPGSTIGPSSDDRASFARLLRTYHRRVWEFTNLVRGELGIDPLPPLES